MSSTSSPQTQNQPQSVSLTVFDAYISSASTLPSLTVIAQTDESFNDVLGFYDQLAFQVVVADTMAGTAPATLTMQIAHSADGINFLYKNPTPEVSLPAQLNIGTATYMSFGFDGGASPSLGLVRLVLVLTAAVGPVRAHVRITVTGNNQNEQAFSRTVMKAMSAQARASQQYVLEYGPGQSVAKSAIAEFIRFINDLPTVSDVQLIQQKTSDVFEAKAFLLWRPILLLKNAGWFSGSSVTVPTGFTIAFLSNGHYVLVTGNVPLWESKLPSSELFPRHLASPAVSSTNHHDPNPWSPIPYDHTGPKLTTGGNPTQGDVDFKQGKGK